MLFTFEDTDEVNSLSVVILDDIISKLLDAIVDGARGNHKTAKGVLVVSRDVKVLQGHGRQVIDKERLSSVAILTINRTVEF